MDQQTADQRLLSLDAFRGITIAGMLLVSNQGSYKHAYGAVKHAKWHGWTPTDLVFPSFLFIVGVAMVFSLPGQLERLGRRRTYLRVLRRVTVLFALGLLLNAWPDFDLRRLEIVGVLQRIALVYLLAAPLVLEVPRRAQAGIAVALLVAYWASLALIEAPGHKAGALWPKENLVLWVDSHWVAGHLWPQSWRWNDTLTVLPSLATTLVGVLAGHWIRSGRDRSDIAAGMFTAGWALILAGLAWDPWLPINKRLWTSSYVLFTGGAALQALACCYWLIDVRSRRKWARPAIDFGLNPIALYVLSTLVTVLMVRVPLGEGGTTANTWIWRRYFAGWSNLAAASLVYSLCYVAAWWPLAAWLRRKRILVKI